MKLVTLNTWGARVTEPFCQFIKEQQNIDIFCFQEIYDKATGIMDVDYPEVRHELLSELRELLPDHEVMFRPVLAGVYGIATSIKKSIPVLEEGEMQIHQRVCGRAMDGHHDRNMQWVKIKHNDQTLTIINVHGLWNGKGKADTPERIAQSTKIKEFMNGVQGPKMLCGDLNLDPNTESVKMLEDGMRNLIKEYGVTSTRTNIYFAKPGKTEKFADYIFTSPEITVKKFEVLTDEVSDHAPLLIDFEL